MGKPDDIPQNVWDATAKLAADRADWLVDAVATSTQNRAFLRGDAKEDAVATESILLNGEKAIRVAASRAILAERERCAAAADAYAKQFPTYPEFDQLYNAAVEIAAAIRGAAA